MIYSLMRTSRQRDTAISVEGKWMTEDLLTKDKRKDMQDSLLSVMICSISHVRVGLVNCTAVSHQGAIQMFRHHFMIW